MLNRTPKEKKYPKLRRLTNSEDERASALARASGIPLSQCPTCRAKAIPVDDDNYGWINGTYRLDGIDHPCDCESQKLLRLHYLVANIGDQYQRLNWADYYGDPDAVEAVKLYLDRWETAKVNGMGLEFSSPNLGVGKTFAATHVAKELVKLGEAAYFIPFLEVVRLYDQDQSYRMAEESRLRDTAFLILDEVVPAVSAAQREFFAAKFEELIRHRTNFNKPTIMTTNLTPDQLHREYPRTYSLLEAKQIRVEMVGADARKGERQKRNLSIMMNEEVEPIT